MSGLRRVFGLHAADKAVTEHAERIRSVWISQDRTDRRLTQLVQSLASHQIAWEPTSKARLDELARGGNHQGIVLEITVPRELDEHDLLSAVELLSAPALILVLDQVQDPHNLGACLRTADATGVTGVVIPKDQSVGLTPVVAKVACGAADTVPLYRVTNLARCLDQLKKSGVWIVGAAGDTGNCLFGADLTLPVAVVLGAEGRGMRRLTREKCDFTVAIPMLGKVESLNVSVAAGVVLYEAIRQRRLHSSSAGSV